jgi:hypothetical protein
VSCVLVFRGQCPPEQLRAVNSGENQPILFGKIAKFDLISRSSIAQLKDACWQRHRYATINSQIARSLHFRRSPIQITAKRQWDWSRWRCAGLKDTVEDSISLQLPDLTVKLPTGVQLYTNLRTSALNVTDFEPWLD